jgi:hypothetical protein
VSFSWNDSSSLPLLTLPYLNLFYPILPYPTLLNYAILTRNKTISPSFFRVRVRVRVRVEDRGMATVKHPPKHRHGPSRVLSSKERGTHVHPRVLVLPYFFRGILNSHSVIQSYSHICCYSLVCLIERFMSFLILRIEVDCILSLSLQFLIQA